MKKKNGLTKKKKRRKIVYNNCESHKMGAAKIPSECLWCERWPVWRYVGVKSVQSSISWLLAVPYY